VILVSFMAGAGGAGDQRQGTKQRVHTGSLVEENGVRGREKGCDDGAAARAVGRLVWGIPFRGAVWRRGGVLTGKRQ
jgi:hypothetical protein